MVPMDRQDGLDAVLTKQFHQLCKGDGVRRWNLPEWIDRRAHPFFGITDRGTYEQVIASVSARLLPLIDRLPDDNLQRIARYCLNLTGDPTIQTLQLVDRRELLAKTYGPAQRTIYGEMRKVVVPELVRMLLAELSQP
jgi:hypothetical protein